MPTPDEFYGMMDEGRWDDLSDQFIRDCWGWDRRPLENHGDVLLRLYETDSDDAKNCLERILDAPRVYRWGPWRGIRKIFKTAEEQGDARFWGIISAAIDANAGVGQVTVRTRHYFKRRSWRKLRTLGRDDGDAYVKFALGLIERYDERLVNNQYRRCTLWAYNHVGWRGTVRGNQPGNDKMFYTITRWRQREGKRYWWQSDQWQADSYDQYPFAEHWKGHLQDIIGGLSRARAGETAKLLISIAERECADEMAAISLEQIQQLFQSDRDPVIDFAMTLIDKVDPASIPQEFVFGLMEHKLPRVVEWALAFIEQHYTFETLGLQRVLELIRHDNEQIATWAMRMLREKGDPKDIAWETIKAWFDSPVPGIREEVVKMVDGNWDVWKPEPKDIFDLFDIIHPDIHKAAFKWLLEKYAYTELGRENIFDLFDSDWADVRDFARRIVEKYFDELDALADLGRLAEHPEPEIQHWVVALVHKHLREDADRLVKLMPFFRQVVFHVNRGGPEKDAIFRMLIELAAGSRARAEAVVKLCAEFIRSFGRTEHVKSLVGLARLRHVYADLDVPIELIPLESAATEG